MKNRYIYYSFDTHRFDHTRWEHGFAPTMREAADRLCEIFAPMLAEEEISKMHQMLVDTSGCWKFSRPVVLNGRVRNWVQIDRYYPDYGDYSVHYQRGNEQGILALGVPWHTAVALMGGIEGGQLHAERYIKKVGDDEHLSLSLILDVPYPCNYIRLPL